MYKCDSFFFFFFHNIFQDIFKMSTEASVKEKIDGSKFKKEQKKQLSDLYGQEFCTEDLNIQKASESIIFFKQKYEKLFYNNEKQFPSIEKVSIIYWSSESNIKQNSVQFSVEGINQDTLNPQCKLSIIIKIDGELRDRKDVIAKDMVIPYSKTSNARDVAKMLLQKKFWVKISSALNNASIHINDLVQGTQQDTVALQLGLPMHQGWKDQENVFQFSQNSNTKKISPLECLDRFKIAIFFNQGKKKAIETGEDQKRYSFEEIMHNFITIKRMQIGKISNSVLEVQNLSILRDEANINVLSKQISILYEYIKKFEINHLPAIKKKDPSFDSDSYYGWRNLQNAIHNSITTEPGYIVYSNKQGDTHVQPVGILNVLMRIKTVDYESPKTSKIFKWTQFKWDQNVSVEKNLQNIYNNRQIYVRFQFRDPFGDSPGGQAVLEIWPPYCCSPIHNHGEAYGLIKVLANQIRVQNFKDLNFLSNDHIPYQQKVYQEGQYSWLTQFSFGIHRLINTTNQTTLSLQTYQGDKGSKEYFEFIFYEDENKSIKNLNSNVKQTLPESQGTQPKEKKEQQLQSDPRKYCQYYPQHDWKNFLHWKSPNETLFQDLQEYVRNVVYYYGEDNSKYVGQNVKTEKCAQVSEEKFKQTASKLNSFEEFALVMKKEYEAFDHLLTKRDYIVKFVALGQSIDQVVNKKH